MNWKLARLVAGWTTGVWLALAAWQVRVLPPTADDWLAEHPLRTAGCPGLEPQLAAWQDELSLQDWTIEIDCRKELGGPDTIGRVRPDVETKSAQIWIREGMSRGWQQATLVHELIHLGVDANRWWVPDGQTEEEFVLAAEFRVYLARRHEMQRRMLREAQRRGRAAATAGPEATVRERQLDGVTRAALAGPS